MMSQQCSHGISFLQHKEELHISNSRHKNCEGQRQRLIIQSPLDTLCTISFKIKNFCPLGAVMYFLLLRINKSYVFMPTARNR